MRTCSIKGKALGAPVGELIPKKPFHYNIQPLLNMQEWMYRGISGGIFALLSRHRTMIGKGISVVQRRPAPRQSDPRNDARNRRVQRDIGGRYYGE